jgi:hypothetical protein
MKKLATFVFALLVAASLSFAQAGGGSTPKTSDDTSKSDTGKKGEKGGKKGHKGGKKGKKSSGGSTTPPPK